MNRAYGTLFYCSHSSQRIEIRCYKMNRADGSFAISIYSHYLSCIAAKYFETFFASQLWI